MHGGWIWAEGRDGRGNSFCFTLPKAKLQQTAAAAAKAAEKIKQEADNQAQNLIKGAESKGMLAKTVARKGADVMKKEADKRANQLIKEADDAATKLIEEAKEKKEEMVKKN
jgi:hypothetical protein